MDILDLIHTNVCGPISHDTLENYRYFITIIDDYSYYGYVELIQEISDSLEAFKAFMTTIEP